MNEENEVNTINRRNFTYDIPEKIKSILVIIISVLIICMISLYFKLVISLKFSMLFH